MKLTVIVDSLNRPQVLSDAPWAVAYPRQFRAGGSVAFAFGGVDSGDHGTVTEVGQWVSKTGETFSRYEVEIAR